MSDTIVPKLFRKFFKDKVYEYEHFNIKVKYKVTGLNVIEWGNSCEYLFNIKVISGEKLKWAKHTWVPIRKNDTNWKREAGRVIRRGSKHHDLLMDIKFFGDNRKSFYNIKRIDWSPL